MSSLVLRRKEFEAKIWDHSVDAFQMQFDEAPALSIDHRKALGLFTASVQALDDAQVAEAVRQYVVVLNSESSEHAEAFVNRLLQLSGLTRNKILTDVKATLSALAGKAESVPSTALKALVSKKTGVAAASALCARLLPVLRLLSQLSQKDQALAFEALNHSTWPGYIRQERAKRQGHEAEGLLARLLRSLRVPFEPALKAENPLTADATVANHSFDLVVPSVSKPRICVKSTVHTSNIGQYGESKDKLEIEEALASLTGTFGATRPKLVAMIDGVGLLSNIEGLNGVLNAADEFCQFRSVWKFGLLSLASCPVPGVALYLSDADLAYYDEFVGRHSAPAGVLVSSLSSLPKAATQVHAGEATFTVPN